jgi:hypothetical protein
MAENSDLNKYKTNHRQVADIKAHLERGLQDVKIIRAGNAGRSCLVVSPSQINISGSMTGEESVGINVIAGKGVAIKGSLGIATMPQNVSIGGLWRFNPYLMSGLPSTVGTPIPVLMFSVPYDNVRDLTTTIATMTTLFSKLSAGVSWDQATVVTGL